MIEASVAHCNKIDMLFSKADAAHTYLLAHIDCCRDYFHLLYV